MRIRAIVGLLAFFIALMWSSSVRAETPATLSRAQKALAHQEAQRIIETTLVLSCAARKDILELLDLAHANKIREAKQRFEEYYSLTATTARCTIVPLGKAIAATLVKRYNGLELDHARRLDVVVLRVVYPGKKVRFVTLSRTRGPEISI